jgi:hypothetical protein
MTRQRASGPRRSRFKLPRLLAVAALTLPLAVFGAPNASAASGPFIIDGNTPDGGAVELADTFGAVKELGPLNSSATKIGVIHSAPPPMLGLTNPNAQVDLRRAWLTTKRHTDGKDWLYFGWERDANTGSGFIAYEFMQNRVPAGCAYGTATDAQLTANCNPWANRKAGDFVILWDQQGGSRDLVLRTWSGTAPNLTLSAGEKLSASVSEAQFSPDGFRGEAAVNLTDTIFGGSTQCRTFANTIPSTVTGNSDTADYKDTILTTAPPISNCESRTVTTPITDGGAVIPAGGVSIGTGVVGVKDSAVVSLQGGTATPAGSVAFSLCKVDLPGLCETGGTSVGSTNLTGTAYPVTLQSPTAHVTSAGRYCWRAVYSGDSANGIPGSSDFSPTECFTVNPVPSALSTKAGPGVDLGNPVTDEATLSGTATQPANPVINTTGAAGPAAGGTITFKLYGPDDCTTLAYTSPAVAVSGNGTYNTPAPQFEPTKPGTYHWVAQYSGSSPNTLGTTHNADCADTNEDVVVTQPRVSLTSAQTWVPNDSVTVTVDGGGTVSGKVSFALYPSSDCTGTALYSDEKSASGASPQTFASSNTIAVSASGTYSWKVAYTAGSSTQRSISASCHETSALTISNGGTVSNPSA